MLHKSFTQKYRKYLKQKYRNKQLKNKFLIMNTIKENNQHNTETHKKCDYCNIDIFLNDNYVILNNNIVCEKCYNEHRNEVLKICLN